MSYELARIIGPIYIILGLSLLIYQASWQRLISEWANNHFQLLSIMFLNCVLGLILISLYNVWRWNIGLLVTITGWALFLKGAFYFLMPGSFIKKWIETKNNPALLVIGGTVCVLIGGFLSYYAYFS